MKYKDLTQEQKKEFYNSCTRIAHSIKSAFEEYYGEDRVDAQIKSFDNFNIWATREYPNAPLERIEEVLQKDLHFRVIVHYPRVTIENEEGEKYTVTDLYSKTEFNYSGLLLSGMDWSRTTYTTVEWTHSYIHSHISYCPSCWDEWSYCCVGQGPIRDTMTIMYSQYDLDTIKLYCFEMDKYIQTESLAGGPYRLFCNLYGYNGGDYESVINNRYHYDSERPIQPILRCTDAHMSIIKEAVQLLLMNHSITFAVVNDVLDITTPNGELGFLLGLAINTVASHKNITALLPFLTPAIIDNGEFYLVENNPNARRSFSVNGTELLLFKGESKHLNIVEPTESADIQHVSVVNPTVLIQIKSKLLKYLNTQLHNNYEADTTEIPF